MRVVAVLAVLLACAPSLRAAVVPVRGDADGSGDLSALDAFYLIHHLNSSGLPIGPCSDANGDLAVNNLDVHFLAEYIFGSGPAPAPVRVYFRDLDNDGFGNPSDSLAACAAPPGYVEAAGDCDDTNDSIHPGGVERCNDLDDDCDTEVDEDFPTLGQACTAGIGACQRSGTIVCRPDGSGTVCSATPGPPALEVCNGLDDNCDGGVDEGLTGCFLMTPGQSPWPSQEDSSHTPELVSMDGYLLLDRSGSMSEEISTVKSNIAAAIAAVKCPPAGSGTPGRCIEDLWIGAGTIGYQFGEPYRNHIDLQPNPVFTALPTTEPMNCCLEAVNAALFSTITGLGSAATGCQLQTYPARTSCQTSPAGTAGFATIGYPCFRSPARKYAFLFTDEPLSDGYACPGTDTVIIPRATSIGLGIAGLYGSGSTAAVINELRLLATRTGAVNPQAGYAHLVFDASGASAPTAFQTALETIAQIHAVDIRAEVVDDPADTVDTTTTFVDRIETLSLGTAECPSTYATFDSDENGFHDTYRDVTTSAPLCWRVVLKQNSTIGSGAAPQTFNATLRFSAEGVVVEERPLVFVVP